MAEPRMKRDTTPTRKGVSECSCGKQFEAVDQDHIVYCTKCKITKGLAKGRKIERSAKD